MAQQTLPSKEAKRFYEQERWAAPLNKVITLRVNEKMGAALSDRAYREGVDLATLCRRYLALASIEEELNIPAD